MQTVLPNSTTTVSVLTNWSLFAAAMSRFAAEPALDGMDNLAGGSGAPHDRNLEARVAVLEEIAAATKGGMAGMRHDMQDMRTSTDRRLAALRDEVTRVTTALRSAQERDFRIMFRALITATLGLAALMAKGFHWF